MVKKYDVAVIGAGPAGSYLASLLEKKLDVVIFEDKKKPGGKACSGLVSKDIAKLLDVDGLVENEMGRCVINAGSDSAKLRIKQGTYALDRDKLDERVAGMVNSGINFGTRVDSVSVGEVVKINTSKGVFKADFVVGADGNNSVVRRSQNVKPVDSVLGLMTMVWEKDGSDAFEVWFDKGIVKDGFLWKIPRGSRVEYGILGTGVKFGPMEDFFNIKNKNCRCERRASPIPTGFHKTYFDRALLVGDAAAQTKPWSFGGILYGMLCGGIAAKTIFETFDKGDFSGGFLKKYQDGWRKELEKSMTMGMMFREFYKELDSEGVKNIVRSVSKSGLKEIDMDHPLTNLIGIV